jgi:DNA-binding NarL/FixJ family response regulator
MADEVDPVDVRVLVVEDHQMVAAAFRTMLETVGGFSVVGTASTFSDAQAMTGYLRPDVAVVDYRMPDGDASDHLAAIFKAHPAVRVLILTGWASHRTIERSMKAGAHGLLSKSQSVEELVTAVRRVAAGESLFEADVAGSRAPVVAEAPSGASLSPREIEVLYLLGEGRRTSEVAGALGLSVNTVRNHITAILAKLGTHTRLEAVTEAMRLGIISSPDSVR